MGLLIATVAAAAAYKFAPKFLLEALPSIELPIVGHVPSACVAAAGAGVASMALSGALASPDERVEGVILVTGCDSGMGFHGAVHLAKLGFYVVAAHYTPDAPAALESACGSEVYSTRMKCVSLDVTSKDSVSALVPAIEAAIAEWEEGVAAAAADDATNAATSPSPSPGLIGCINCAGVGFTGPAEYFPLDMYRRAMEVNFFGYVAVAQAVLPMLRTAAAMPGARRARLVFIGTGGGPVSPAPAMLSGYMASKWAGEAWMQAFRMEMQLTKQRVDGSMINPGFVKPTNLVAGGKVLIERMWAASPQRARDEYESHLEAFQRHSDNEPGTHVSFVAKAMEQIMKDAQPELSYKVGPDSKAAPYVGCLPTNLRERLVRYSIFKQ